MIDRPRPPAKGMIGYNRTVKLRWLDETLDLFLAGMSDAGIYEALRERLKDELSVGSTAKRGSREKTITLLMPGAAPSRNASSTFFFRGTIVPRR